MAQPSPELLARARNAQEKLLNQLINHPDVTLIDIGYAEDTSTPDQITLRIHVRDHWFQRKPAGGVTLPATVDGFPIVVLRGDYRARQ